MGHTPQQTGEVSARCNMTLDADDVFQPRIYLIDVAISQAYGSLGKGKKYLDFLKKKN